MPTYTEELQARLREAEARVEVLEAALRGMLAVENKSLPNYIRTQFAEARKALGGGE